MLVMSRRDIVLAGMITLRQDGVNIIHLVACIARLD
jgi:hypothetical protein